MPRRAGCRRRISRWLTGLWLLGCGAPGAGPHVVLISVDTLRADHVGLYGYDRDTTPAIDRWFGNASIFENAMSPAPCTVPSVRQMLSGAYDFRRERPTLPELLSELGYRTAAFLSQHLFRGERERFYARGFSHFDLQPEDEVDRHGFPRRDAREVSDRAIAWLEQHAGEPKIFLWLHYFDPHDPYEPPPEHRGFDAGNPSQRTGDRRSDLVRDRATPDDPWRHAGHVFSDDDVAHLVNLYDGEIAYTDAQIGRVLARLDSLGLGDRSIVALTADHGEWLGEEDRWDHCMTLRDVEVRVPLLIRALGGPLGRIGRTRTPATALDLLPTLAGAVGATPPDADYHGRDLRQASRHRAVSAFWRGARVVRSRDWKLHLGEGGGALYAIESDPAETTDRLASQPEVARRLAKRAGALDALARTVARETEETAEALRRLGYVE